jgi:uncharacterized protein HemX
MPISRRYSSLMLLLAVIALAVGFSAGALIFWIVRGNRTQETEIRLRAEQLGDELAQRTAALERSESDRERLRDLAAKLQSEIAALRATLDGE